MAKIEYDDKESIRSSELPAKNTVRATDLNEIKNSVNALYDLIDKKKFQTLVDGANIDFDYSKGYNASIILGGNRTLNEPSNMEDGDYAYLRIVQDGSGNRTLTLPSSFKVVNGGAGALTLSSDPDAIDSISFVKFGSTYEVTFGENFTAAP